MKKIIFLILIFCISICNQLFAQNIIPASCVDVKTDGIYIPQVIIYGNESFTYFTEYEKGKEKNGVSSIAKYDKDMNFISRFMLDDMKSDSKNKDEETTLSFYTLKENILIVSRTVIENNNEKYSIGVVGYDLKLIQYSKEIYSTNDEFAKKVGSVISADSTSLLFIFGQYKKYGKKHNNIITYCVNVDQTGKTLFQKSIEFNGIDNYDNTIKEIIYLDGSIYFGIALGYQEMSNTNLYGIAKKNENQRYNYLIYQYSVLTSSLKQILNDKNVEDNYIYDNLLTSRNGVIYLLGCYTTDRSASAQIFYNYDGHYLIRIDPKTNKVLTSNFWENDLKQKSFVTSIKFKENGGYYVISENNNTNGFSFSDNMYIYNFDNSDKLIWKKKIEKQHQGGNLQKGAQFMYSIEFVKENDLYILMNENKKNAELPINAPMAEYKNWEKGGLYCISFIYGDNFEKKKIIFNSDEFGCDLYTSNPWYFTIHSKYMTERLSSYHINLKQNKIYNIGGIDEKRKISTLKIE
ncbi:MAG: hypothetical protein U0T69_03400 [Chitinophagales bacterium]